MWRNYVFLSHPIKRYSKHNAPETKLIVGFITLFRVMETIQDHERKHSECSCGNLWPLSSAVLSWLWWLQFSWIPFFQIFDKSFQINGLQKCSTFQAEEVYLLTGWGGVSSDWFWIGREAGQCQEVGRRFPATLLLLRVFLWLFFFFISRFENQDAQS